MGAIDAGHWVCQMADVLTREILEEMAEIRMTRCVNLEAPASRLDAVCGLVDGIYQLELRFRAEENLFWRLAENMIGGKPEDTEEVQEYAREFFNTLCGRFISEIYRETKIPARFYPVRYESAAENMEHGNNHSFTSINFVSDQKEYAEFSWTRDSMEELLKRSEKK